MGRRIFFPLFMVLAGPALAQAPSAVQGKPLFLSHCSACHQASGAGGVHLGSAISADLRAPGLEDTYKHSDKLLLRAILHGRDEQNQPLDKPMPIWAGKLSPAQVLDIIAYLKTLKS